MSAELRERVVAEAWSWVGTPYHHHGRIKGAGVDCAQLLCAVYEAAGLIGHIDPGFYPHDWHQHREEEMFLDWLARAGAHRVDAPMTGDVAIFRFGRTFSHGAVLVAPDTVVHAYLDQGVVVNTLAEYPLTKLATQFWSLIK